MKRAQITKASLFYFVFVMYSYTTAGPFGLEDQVSTSGPGMTLVYHLVLPFFWCIPISLVAAELTTAMPVQGGFYRWTRAAFGDFWGFLAGWWNCCASFFLGSAYAVLFTDYLCFYFPQITGWNSANEPNPQSALPGPSLAPQLYSWLGIKGSSFPVGAAAAAAPTPQTVIVPNSIKVGHNCTLSNNQIVCTSWDPAISLETYVSNGLLGEWLSPWVDDSLKAGSAAYRSYGAWYVAHPISSNYDICDNTLCQVYNPTLFPPTKREQADVVATAGVVMSRDNVNIFKAEYAAESNLASDTQYATCPDGQVGEPTQSWPCMRDFVDKGKHQASTHSRGMCQRGSQRWASGEDNTGATGDTGQPILNSDGVPILPRDWRCILDHYYNANATVSAAHPNQRLFM